MNTLTAGWYVSHEEYIINGIYETRIFIHDGKGNWTDFSSGENVAAPADAWPLRLLQR